MGQGSATEGTHHWPQFFSVVISMGAFQSLPASYLSPIKEWPHHREEGLNKVLQYTNSLWKKKSKKKKAEVDLI